MKITLCGSARFESAFHEWNKKLTLAGHVVYSLAVFPSQEQEKNWYTERQKQTLDLIHLAKIENSDWIFVLDVGGYVGESTAREIQFAKIMKRGIYLLTEVENNPPLENALLNP